MKHDKTAEIIPYAVSPISMLSDIVRLFDESISLKSDAMKLQTGARRVLSCLAVRDGVSQLDLVRATRLKAPTISLIVQKMEKDGIVTRKADDIDMRLTRVFLTEAGNKMNQVLDQSVKELETTVFGDFSEDEKKQFSDLIERAYTNIKKEVQMQES